MVWQGHQARRLVGERLDVRLADVLLMKVPQVDAQRLRGQATTIRLIARWRQQARSAAGWLGSFLATA